MRRITTAFGIVAALGVAACEADREAFEAGADLDAPPAVEEAPAVPFPPTPVVTGGPETADTTATMPQPAEGTPTPAAPQ